MIDEVTLYVIKSWGLFMLVLLPVGEALVLLIGWIFSKWEEKRNETKQDL